MKTMSLLSVFTGVTLTKKFACISQFRNMSYTCKKLIFEEYGNPVEVVKLREETLPNLKASEVLIKFLVSSINPADINFVQGVYAVKPESFPAVGGFEGVGEVLEVGTDVNDLQVGDRVIPDSESLGTWRTHGIFNRKLVLKVPKDVDVVKVAGVSSNPSTAFRMLKDFVKLQPGDSIIQNAANSACGQNVIQLSKNWNLKSVNIIRDRPEVEKLKTYLKSLGADYVFTEEELRNTKVFKTEGCPKPKLALNAVGGRNATEISRHLDSGGVMVTYGGMSKEPVSISVSSFIFKDLSFRGYWMTRWTRENRYSEERKKMLDDLFELMRTDKLKAPAHKKIPISEYKEALEQMTASNGYIGHKYLLDFN